MEMEEEEERVDLISGLPQDVQRHIISLLPLDEAVRTSAFSTAWRSLWVPVSAKGELNDLIFMLSKPCLHSHQKWKLGLTNQDEAITVLATKGVEQQLHLEFSNGEKEEEKNLSLKLRPTICLASHSTLKKLCLRSVNNHGKDLISALFSISKCLESLELEHCVGLQSLDIEANDCFQSLKVLGCPDMVNITVSARNLRSFWYQGVLPQIQLMNCSDNLVGVKLDLRDGFRGVVFDCEDVISFLTSLKEIEVLTISSCLLEWLCLGGVIFSRLELRFNKLKELRYWMDFGMNKTKRDSLLCFLNICPSLEKLVIKIDSSLINSVPCPYFHQYLHEPHLWMDDATVKSNTSELQHLKIVEMWGYQSEEDELLLMEVLMDKAKKLGSITVTSPENHSWRLQRLSRHGLIQVTNNQSRMLLFYL